MAIFMYYAFDIWVTDQRKHFVLLHERKYYKQIKKCKIKFIIQVTWIYPIPGGGIVNYPFFVPDKGKFDKKNQNQK